MKGNNQVQEVQSPTHPRRYTLRHVLAKLIKIKHKERILKAVRDKQQVIHKVNLICLTADLSAETPTAGREWQDTFNVLKGKKKKSTTKITLVRKQKHRIRWLHR